MILDNPILSFDEDNNLVQYFEGYQTIAQVDTKIENEFGDIVFICGDPWGSIEGIKIYKINSCIYDGGYNILKSNEVNNVMTPLINTSAKYDKFKIIFNKKQIIIDFCNDNVVNNIYNNEERMEIGFDEHKRLSYINIDCLTDEEYRKFINVLKMYKVNIVKKNEPNILLDNFESKKR